jgi:DNA-binding NarL/FixJ family response regulator
MAARVLIIDDDGRFRALARTLLEAHGFEVVAEAADGAEALRASRRVRPDAALVDIGLPDTNGFTLARELISDTPGLQVLLTSTDPTLVTRSALADSGALAFVAKDRLAVTELAVWLGSGTTPQAPFRSPHSRGEPPDVPSGHERSDAPHRP